MENSPRDNEMRKPLVSYLAERGLENGKPSSKGERGGEETFQVENSSGLLIGYEATKGSHLSALQPSLHVLNVY